VISGHLLAARHAERGRHRDACAAPRGFVCPAHGGPTWREVSREHVVLRTDLEEATEAFERSSP
jgi:hypothetical protein